MVFALLLPIQFSPLGLVCLWKMICKNATMTVEYAKIHQVAPNNSPRVSPILSGQLTVSRGRGDQQSRAHAATPAVLFVVMLLLPVACLREKRNRWIQKMKIGYICCRSDTDSARLCSLLPHTLTLLSLLPQQVAPSSLFILTLPALEREREILPLFTGSLLLHPLDPHCVRSTVEAASQLYQYEIPVIVIFARLC